jgi:hypothetical protein
MLCGYQARIIPKGWLISYEFGLKFRKQIAGQKAFDA